MDVFLIDSSKPLSQDSPKYFNTDSLLACLLACLLPITGVDLLALEKGKLIALCLDKKTVRSL